MGRLRGAKALSIFFGCLVLLTIVLPVAAQERPAIQVTLGSFSKDSFTTSQSCAQGSDCPIAWIGEYIKAIYEYGVALTAVLSAVVIMSGGFLWLTSAGSPQRVTTAKEMIGAALSGLVIALFSFIILYSINPRLTVLEPINLKVPTSGTGACPSGQIPDSPPTGIARFLPSYTNPNAQPTCKVDPNIKPTELSQICCQGSELGSDGHITYRCHITSELQCGGDTTSHGNTQCGSDGICR